jgi:hypothetical protein
MDERRRVRRIRVFKGAKIVANTSLHDCAVRDISSLGARLATASTDSLPDRFALALDTAGTVHACRIAWRTSTQIGIEFCRAA